MPTGITLYESGLISGTPTETGKWVFTVKATDGNDLWTTGEFSITVE